MSKLKPIYVLGSRSNPSSQHNDEVESVPAILEEVRTETNQFNGRLNGVDDVEDQIDILKIALKLRWFVVPCQRETNGVDYDAQEDEIVKQIVGRHLVAGVLEFVSRDLVSGSWFLGVAKHQNITPISLELRELMVHVESFFFTIEDVDNDSHEHVKDK